MEERFLPCIDTDGYVVGHARTEQQACDLFDDNNIEWCVIKDSHGVIRAAFMPTE